MMYESEDENMSRVYSRTRQTTPLYSKEDIREQYCISDRGLGALETDQRSLFSCLSTYQNSPCSTRSSLLTVCVKQKIPSDENLHDLLKRYPFEYTGYHRRGRYSWGVPPPEIYPFDEELGCSYFRRKPRVDPRRYTWMPADDESIRLERPRSVLDYCGSINAIPPPPPPVSRTKHVSFARSHTLTSFDETAVSLGSSSSHISKLSHSQERLIPLLGQRRSSEVLPITQQPSPTEQFKRTPSSMKTQATQTEVCLGRKPHPPHKLNLSPRTMHRVRMVSQGAQTNGILNGRKLMKSFSEVGGDRFGKLPYATQRVNEHEVHQEPHEPLHRAHSDEPPRSPFILTSPPPKLCFSDNELFSSSQSEHDSDDTKDQELKPQKEIIIDFEPQTQFSPIQVKRKRLQKAVSDGEILLDQKSTTLKEIIIPEAKITSFSSENVTLEQEPRKFIPYFQNSPIKHEGVCKSLVERSFSSTEGSFEGSQFRPRDSLDEEFHENLIYKGKYLRRSGSSTSDDLLDNELRLRRHNDIEHQEVEEEEDDRYLLPDHKLSTFASNESLENEFRDHSDGNWNESQATVLQMDSGTDNGTGLSSSERASLTPSSGSSMLLTPSSRKKHLLLLQHQQRSSMDTDALDEELVSQIQVQNPNVLPRVDLPSISLSRPESTNLRYNTRSSTTSLIRKSTREINVETVPPIHVPDILPQIDAAKLINTDLSESTTTTDDYVTATSGTDSSRKNGSKDVSEKQLLHTVLDGSSIESVSSTYVLGKPETLADDMIVPSISPCTIPEEPSDVTSGSSTRRRLGRVSPSGSSSSSGSYSLDGSFPEVPLKPSVPTSRRVPSLSEDERSTHYSSSGNNDSPAEDDHTLKPLKSEKSHWAEDERKKRRRAYTLDIDKNKEGICKDNHKSNFKQTKRSDESMQFLSSNDKPKRSKLRTRSPIKSHLKALGAKKITLSNTLKSERVHEPKREKTMEKKPLTSDESSSGIVGEQTNSGQLSPKRSKKSRDSNRRKSIPRSPTGSRAWKHSSETAEGKSSSLPGTLARRKSSLQSNRIDSQSKSRLSPYSTSPIESPNRGKHSPKASPESTRLKALSAESLRSVSPGSDSVFYSDPSSHIAFADHQVHCLHCGKEVDVINADHPKKGVPTSGSTSVEIVQPPAGFADSPRIKSGRLYKKLEKRFRSEERQYHEKCNNKSGHDIRAKSEERGDKSGTRRSKLRPMARSNNSSLEGLRATDSSPSILPAAPEDEDDLGVYSVPYTEGNWVYIDDNEELYAWTKNNLAADNDSGRRDSISSITSTESESEFIKRYQAITHRMIHRRCCLEMYKRQALKSFGSDKTVILRRVSGEFGFRIHGSKPVVVSAIEPETPAESSGLEIGDIVLAVNGISVLDKTHTEVVKVAHAGSDTLTLEVTRTCDVLSPSESITESLYMGYLWKLSGSANELALTKWVRRWFILKNDSCLYCYKSDSEKQFLGGTMLLNCNFYRVDNASSGIPARGLRFDIKRSGLPPLHFAADSEQTLLKWTEILSQVSEVSQAGDKWLEHTKNNLQYNPSVLHKPDCVGYLIKLGNQWKSWNRRYCVLKDGCLFFYSDINAKNAFGVACLHGYRVQQTTAGAKRHAFEIVPSNSKQKHFYFYTESEFDRRRWVAALEYSIDRWLKVC